MDCMKSQFVEGVLLDGRYRSISPLNHGSFGMVFLAKDTFAEKLVAIKCLSKASSTKDCPAVDLEENSVELSYHDRLGHHSNIVDLLHSFETDAHIFLVLEYYSMGDLYEAIRLGRGPLETENVREFMLQLLGAVEFMHSKGLFHRDIKPENIFLTAEGSMKLGDLGLATADAWSHEASVGSDRYMAPEQYDPSEIGYSPAKADIWAIGICLLNVLFGRNPFVTPTESDVLFADFARDNQSLFDIFPNMSQDTYNILVHAMAIDPTKRSLSAVREALLKAISFTTNEDAFDEFCTETRDAAPASANREPLRTPSIQSPQVDQGGAFPWSKALHMSPSTHTRQLSVIADTESYTEDLFPPSEKDRTSWYSSALNSSMTSGLDSTFGGSLRSTAFNPPATRNFPRSKPVQIPSSLPSRVATFSSIFGKKDSAVSKSWTDIYDEDEEDAVAQLEKAHERRREQNSRTWSLESKIDEPTLRAGLSEIQGSATNARTQSLIPPKSIQNTESGSDNEVFVFEEAAQRYSPPKKSVDPQSPKRTIMDKWAALGNRRRQFSQGSESCPEVNRKRMIPGKDWRTGFGLKVFSGTAGWDKSRSTNARVFDWRRDAHGQQESREDLGFDIEWVGDH